MRPDRDHPFQEQGRSAAPRTAVVCALLTLAIGLVFGRTTHHDFVNYDDKEYVYENPLVAGGLTAKGIEWAFTQRYAGNWHPLSWLSHMLDSQFYGLRAGGHHLTSVLLHAAAAILLFLVLRQMTGRQWTSAFAAAVFGVHPLRVESVAWVAERKDVLSGVFLMLTLGAFVRYVRRPDSSARYLALIVVYALGLMAKPMLVTLPLVLPLLDWWPLGRVRRLSFAFLVREKLPLLLLAGASCAVTLWAQQEALMPLPFAQRLGNAVVAYVAYVGMFLYPAHLAVFYPHPHHTLPAVKIAAAALALAGLTAAALALRRKHPHLIVGWLWYLGMLVPVIGLVQVGQQAMADRYTYLSQIGLGVAAAWAGAAACRSGAHRRWVPVAAGASVVLLAALALRQTGYWRDGETLFTHALASTSKNHIAHNNLGEALFDRGLIEGALEHYRQALEIQPTFAEARYNLGIVMAGRGQLDEAVAQYRKALEIKPGYAEARYNLGNALSDRGQLDEAIAQYRRALEIKPDFAEAHNNLGNALSDRGQLDEAIVHYRKTLEIKPGFAQTHNNLGIALAGRGQLDEAIVHYRQALEFRPDYAKAHVNLGNVLAGRGQLEEAIVHYRQALEIKPDFAEAHVNFGNVLAARGQLDEAIVRFRRALDLAQQQGKQGLTDGLRRRLATYEAGRPVRR